jgi:hypothetical protein
MYADVPMQHSFTIYAEIGDAFAWLCIAGFLSTIVLAPFRKHVAAKRSQYIKNMKASFAE